MKTRGTFAPGFRLSEMDVGFMLVVCFGSPLLGRRLEQLVLAAYFAVFHFFLFCNVLRAHRVLELLWAAAFVSLWCCSFFFGVPSWGQSYLLAFGLTLVIAVVEILLPSYHGAFWSALNPRLPQWWEEQTGSKL
jgi:hypothetical protein